MAKVPQAINSLLALVLIHQIIRKLLSLHRLGGLGERESEVRDGEMSRLKKS